MNDPLIHASRLRREAEDLLVSLDIAGVLGQYGPVSFVGSFFLDLMAYPDIDINTTGLSLEQVFQFAVRISNDQRVRQVIFERGEQPDVKGGLYLKFRVRAGEWGRPWKIDLWTFPPALYRQRLAENQHFKDRLTPVLREQILRYKLSILTPQLRTPKYSGYWIYRAFLDEGLRDFKQVSAYLVANGIQLDPARV